MQISRLHPWLYKAAVSVHRARRRARWYFGAFADERGPALPFKVEEHRSVLLRKLGNVDMQLQHNKVTNLRLAAEKVTGILIKPGETFSLWKLVGSPTAEKGYLEGLLISNGEVKKGVGGGLCQIANLIYWMALHTPLEITERHRHSFDIFPDSGRVLPFGTGATIFYNYIDLQLFNPTQETYQILVWVTDEHLRGEVHSDKDLAVRYRILERNHRYLKDHRSGTGYRANEIYRKTFDRVTGKELKEELLYENFCEMKYDPPADAPVIDIGEGKD